MQQFVGLDFAIDFPKLDRSLADKAGGVSAAMSYPALRLKHDHSCMWPPLRGLRLSGQFARRKTAYEKSLSTV